MDFFKDICNAEEDEENRLSSQSKFQRIITEKGLRRKSVTGGRVSINIVSDSSRCTTKTDLQALFQPATALKSDQKFQDDKPRLELEGEEKEADHFLLSDNNISDDHKSSSSSDDDGESSLISSSCMPIRLNRSLSIMQFSANVPKRTIQVRNEDGEFTEEFKKTLYCLAKKRLEDEHKDIIEDDQKNNIGTEDIFNALVNGALSFLNKVDSDNLQVDGACTMIPEEYVVSAQKADFGRSQSDILNYEIDRMRGSMRLGTAQTSRKETKDAQVTSEQEQMLRKDVEIGFLLNEPSVTLSIARFIEEDHTIRQFRNMGLRQRSQEAGRVLLNKLFTQEYKNES